MSKSGLQHPKLFGITLVIIFVGGLMALTWLMQSEPRVHHPLVRNTTTQNISPEEIPRPQPANIQNAVATTDRYENWMPETKIENEPYAPGPDTRRVWQMIEKSTLIHTDQRLPNSKGEYQRFLVYETKSDIPLVAVHEVWKMAESGSGDDVLLDRSAMVADHLLISLNDGQDPAQLQSLVSQYQAGLVTYDEDQNLYLLQFDGTNAAQLANFADDLRTDASVKWVEPDYLVSLPQ